MRAAAVRPPGRGAAPVRRRRRWCRHRAAPARHRWGYAGRHRRSVVLDAAEHLHAALLEQRAADPAGGLGEPVADLARPCAAAARAWRGGAGSCAGSGRLAARTLRRCPTRRGMPRPPGHRRAPSLAWPSGRRRACGEQLGDVEADPAGADDRHASSRAPAPARRSRRSLPPWGGRCRACPAARHDAGGEDHRRSLAVVRGTAPVQFELRTPSCAQPRAEVAQRFARTPPCPGMRSRD